MHLGRKTANAVGGKTARACDSCVRKQARWYCAADDAFLCRSCDASVHSANHLAGQHERVRLGTVSLNSGKPSGLSEPSWHQGFARRARTPRPRSKRSPKMEEPCAPLVPDLSPLDEIRDEEQLLYRVPVFDPFGDEIEKDHVTFVLEKGLQEETCNLDDLQDLELQEFAADVESLLGKGFDEDVNNMDIFSEGNRVKVEHDEEVEAMLGCGETFGWDFDYASVVREEAEVGLGFGEDYLMPKMINDRFKEEEAEEEGTKERRLRILLRLNYDDVIKTWADQRSPWTTGTRPEVPFDDRWPDFVGADWSGNNPCYGGVNGGGGREARVSRYREKRRTRLFSKKIRYEVRKLNAERRPRMKGRFVKLENFGQPPCATPSILTPYHLIKK